MNQKMDYTPIDCNFYDRLEAWSVRNERVTICLTGKITIQNGLIRDLFIKDKVEYLLLDNGVEIRLDNIVSVNGILLDGSCGV